MKEVFVFIFIFGILFHPSLFAQDDLLEMIENDSQNDEEQKQEVVLVTATFKGTRIVNMQSPEIPGKGVMQFLFMHRFGAINDDFFYNFFGLDIATIRLSLDYSITDWLNVGFGRSSATKTWDGFVKLKMLRQSTGGRNMPFSAVLYSTINYSTLRFDDGLPHNESDRLSYSYQLILARKFSDRFSFELVPTMVHYNLVQTRAQPNDVFALGFGGRFKITQRLAITGEYMLQMPKNTYFDQTDQRETPFNNALSIGFDIETGGHVFQLHFTNSRGLVDPQWIGRTPGSWGEGEIYFGFNISRVFTIVRPKTPDEPDW
jgi:hypothetical protein